MSLCKYRHVFGREGEGIHSFRFMNVAIVDVLMTVVAAIVVSYITEWNVCYVTTFLFVLAILLHRLFCVNTTINKAIFGEV
jgi:hypothetical protein